MVGHTMPCYAINFQRSFTIPILWYYHKNSEFDESSKFDDIRNLFFITVFLYLDMLINELFALKQQKVIPVR